jgi:hypothetical protein
MKKSTKKMKPYQNEEDSIAIGDLTVENRLDRVELYGSLHLTRDKRGLALAKELKALLDDTIKALEAEDLPDEVKTAPTDQVDNPFGN